MKIIDQPSKKKYQQIETNQQPESRAKTNLLGEKVEELAILIERSNLSKDELRHIQGKFSDVFEKLSASKDPILPFKALSEDNNLSREELLDGLEQLLMVNQIDSDVSRKYIRKNYLQKIILAIISLLLVGVGFAMIIMPAPPSFEIFTVFYFTPDDGVTVMDLVSLVIIFSGIFLFVSTFNKK